MLALESPAEAEAESPVREDAHAYAHAVALRQLESSARGGRVAEWLAVGVVLTVLVGLTTALRGEAAERRSLAAALEASRAQDRAALRQLEGLRGKIRQLGDVLAQRSPAAGRPPAAATGKGSAPDASAKGRVKSAAKATRGRPRPRRTRGSRGVDARAGAVRAVGSAHDPLRGLDSESNDPLDML